MREIALEARGLTVDRGERRVLDGVDVDLVRGEVHAILGPNGAGKSTLIRALLGLVTHRGSVRIDGELASRLSAQERSARVAYVPQRSELTASLSVEHVVALGRVSRSGAFGPEPHVDEVARAAMERMDVARLARRAFPTLSFGERARVLVARALATGARTLLLDEPTASLDVRHTLELLELVRSLAAEGRAVAVVMHSLEDASRCADVATILRAGRVAHHGPAHEVISPRPVRDVYGVELLPRSALGFRLEKDS